MVKYTKNWTKNECLVEALKYNNKTDFKTKSPAAYGYSYRHGWLDEVCSHIVSPHKPKGYWTKEQCLNIAKNYQDRRLFKINDKRAYEVSAANNWLDNICAHMPVLGHMNLRKIYVYEFDDRSCYVGLSCDPERRHRQHMRNKDGVLRQEGTKGLKFKQKIFDEWLSAHKAKKVEQETITSYLNNGWKIRNKAKAGGLGSSKQYWTKKRCISEALKYKIFKDFRTNSNSCYVTAAKYGWIDKICSHMIRVQTQKNFWKDKSNCEIEAKKYNFRTDFRIGARGAYESCRINGWLDELCSHMVATRRPAGYWTKDMCIQEVMKYRSKAEFIKGAAGAYSSCRKNGWTTDVVSHLKKNSISQST
jgi:predicted GIY-YIG superfamily endonuclease